MNTNSYYDEERLPFDEEDPRETFERNKAAAERGSSVAQFNLALCYANGTGTERDPAKAVEWFVLAAENGDDAAPYFLGHCYETGDGVEQDLEKAAQWYEKAPEQWFPEAKIRLERLRNK